VFEKFTQPARQVIVLAEREAGQMNHDAIGSEHLLLGLLQAADPVAADALGESGISYERALAAVAGQREGTGAAAPDEKTAALAAIGVDVAAIRLKAEQAFGPGSLHYPRVRFSPAAKSVLQLSLEEAAALSHFFIGPGHLLLAILTENGGGKEVIAALGADAGQVRASVIRRVSPAAERIRVASAEISRLDGMLSALARQGRPEASDLVDRLRHDTGAVYEQASDQSRKLQERLADDLERVTAAFTADPAAAKPP
jgi:ATP-dependent Clp protease ATP-binding subunit ClpA